MVSKQGTLLERNAARLFRYLGFKVATNIKLKGYEIDVCAKDPSGIDILVECKQKDVSHSINLRSLLHEWHSKNQVIAANYVLIIVWGVQISFSHKQLAKNLHINLWGEEEFEKYLQMALSHNTSAKRTVLNKLRQNLLNKKLTYDNDFEPEDDFMGEISVDEVEKIVGKFINKYYGDLGSSVKKIEIENIKFKAGIFNANGSLIYNQPHYNLMGDSLKISNGADFSIQINRNGKIVGHNMPQLTVSHCFIATAAYGTPFAQEINLLRKWRDYYLASNFLGKFLMS